MFNSILQKNATNFRPQIVGPKIRQEQQFLGNILFLS